MNEILDICDEIRELNEERLPDDEARSNTNIAQRGQEEDEINQQRLG